MGHSPHRSRGYRTAPVRSGQTRSFAVVDVPKVSNTTTEAVFPTTRLRAGRIKWAGSASSALAAAGTRSKDLFQAPVFSIDSLPGAPESCAGPAIGRRTPRSTAGGHCHAPMSEQTGLPPDACQTPFSVPCPTRAGRSGVRMVILVASSSPRNRRRSGIACVRFSPRHGVSLAAVATGHRLGADPAGGSASVLLPDVAVTAGAGRRIGLRRSLHHARRSASVPQFLPEPSRPKAFAFPGARAHARANAHRRRDWCGSRRGCGLRIRV